jgi:hypothetical protein
LLGGPLGRGGVGDVDVDDASRARWVLTPHHRAQMRRGRPRLA